ncbi:MAG TPA: Crp/Fnr family transcriptional regulator [Candidatus Coprenecus pullistercoris]|nr:Crp/Fnr family transcriptional regulator [Candidatus Coprenecus pullistercoris]
MSINPDFKKEIQHYSTFIPPDDVMDLLSDAAEEVRLKPKEILIRYGQCDPSLYIVKDGILQFLYFDGEKETTFGFAFAPTILCAPHCMYGHEPSVMQIEACKIATTLLRIPENRFYSIMQSSHEFAQWMFNIALGQFYYSETKLTMISGHAVEKYRNLLKIRPDIVKAISSRRLASYLGVTPSWLCKLRKKMLYE